MNFSPAQQVKLTRTAGAYMANNADLPAGGYVMIWRHRAVGWAHDLDRPASYEPGVLAVARSTCQIFVATGGDPDKGAEKFICVLPPLTPATREHDEPSPPILAKCSL